MVAFLLLSVRANFQKATAFGPHDSRLAVTEHNVFLYDRLLGITTRVSVPPAVSAVVGSAACCEGASSSSTIAKCSLTDRLAGKCCDQKPCRIGGLNPEISRDGQKIVFISDVNYEGAGIKLVKGDLEVWVHHIPTSTSHRVTYSHDKSIDETAPHISGDGSVVTFQSKHSYAPHAIEDEKTNNFDIWATTLTYGCDDPRASNYATDYDIPECCTWSDTGIGVEPFAAGRQRVTLTLSPVDFSGAAMSASDLQALSASASGCQQWQHDVLSDVACALRVPAARLAIWEPSVCASAAGKLQVVIDVLPAKFGHTPTELVSRLAVQVKEPGSPIWKGYATRYLDASQAMGLSASAVFVPAPSMPPPAPPSMPTSAPPIMGCRYYSIGSGYHCDCTMGNDYESLCAAIRWSSWTECSTEASHTGCDAPPSAELIAARLADAPPSPPTPPPSPPSTPPAPPQKCIPQVRHRTNPLPSHALTPTC